MSRGQRRKRQKSKGRAQNASGRLTGTSAQQKIARSENSARKSGDFAPAPAGNRTPSAAASAGRPAAAAAVASATGPAVASSAGSGPAAAAAAAAAVAAPMGSAPASAARAPGSGSSVAAAADRGGLQVSMRNLERHACHLPLSFIAVYETSPGFDRDKRCLLRQKGQITARIRGFAVSVGQPSVSGSDRSSYK